MAGNASRLLSCSQQFNLVKQAETAFNLLDKFETREYREAMEIVPGLVERETPIHIFLRALQNNPFEAAKRISYFWKYRKITFGERWLLPMTITGSGALNDFDIRLVKSGTFFFIPRPNTGPVVIVDFSKALDIFADAKEMGVDNKEMVMRCGFYMGVAFAEICSQGECVLMHPVTSEKRPAMEFRKESWDIVLAAFPCRFKNYLVPQACEEGKQELLDFMRQQISSFLRFNTGSSPQQLYADSTSKVIGLLENSGISRNVIPVTLGGDYNYDAMVAQWVRMRLSVDSFLSPIPNPNFAGSKAIVQSGVTNRKFKPLLQRKADESEEEYLRQRNRLYSRRNNRKQQIAAISLEGTRDQLEEEKRALLQINQQLRYALQQAKMVLVHHGIYLDT